MNESLTHIFDKAFKQSTMTIKDSIQVTTGWARVLWQRMKEPAGEIVGRKLLYFLRVPKNRQSIWKAVYASSFGFIIFR